MLLAVTPALSAEAGYVNPVECRPCHQQIYDSYRQTGMGRSLRPAVTVPPLAAFFHSASERYYSVVERGGVPFLRRSQEGGANAIEKRIDFAIGSGNHSTTFVHRNEQGRLIELPVSWYSERGGYWAMSPGYDRPDHSDFRREVSDSCLFCHNGYPSQANGGLADGIDCQRCHGPGEEHTRRRGPILNPKRVSFERQTEVCLQCHLESAGRNMPDAIRRFDRAVFSYRPGESLAEYMLYFRLADLPSPDGITVNSSAHRLRESRCFVKSNGRLTCTTCHDPHRSSAAVDYTAACRVCHAAAHTAATKECTGCHMPRTRTQDAVHVVMTDHAIRRKPRSGDLLAPIPENHERRTGTVGFLYPEKPRPSAEAGLYLAIAQMRSSANPRRDAAQLEQAIARLTRPPVEAFVALAEGYGQAGEAERAIEAWKKALVKNPDHPAAIMKCAEVLAARGRIGEALTLLESAVARLPANADLLNALAVLYGRQQRFPAALRLLTSALQTAPEDPVTWLNLGVCLEASGDKKGAEAAYRQAVLLQPDLARAQEFLKRVLEN